MDGWILLILKFSANLVIGWITEIMFTLIFPGSNSPKKWNNEKSLQKSTKKESN